MDRERRELIRVECVYLILVELLHGLELIDARSKNIDADRNDKMMDSDLLYEDFNFDSAFLLFFFFFFALQTNFQLYFSRWFCFQIHRMSSDRQRKNDITIVELAVIDQIEGENPLRRD